MTSCQYGDTQTVNNTQSALCLNTSGPQPRIPASTNCAVRYDRASLRETTTKNHDVNLHDPSDNNQNDVVNLHDTNSDNNQKNKSFYSEPESSGSGSGTSSEESSSEEESSEEEESTNENEPKKVAKADRVKQVNNYRSRSESSNSGTSDSASDSDSETESGSDLNRPTARASQTRLLPSLPIRSRRRSSESADSSGESDPPLAKPANKVKEKKVVTNQKQEKQEANQEKKNNDKSNLELLLELDDAASTLLPTMTPTCGGFLSPANTIPGPIGDGDAITPVGPSFTPTVTTELISRVTYHGVSGTKRWTRAPHLFSHKMCAIELTFTNNSNQEVTAIRVNKKTLTGSRAIHDFAPIPVLSPGASANAILGVDFADTIQPIEFTVISSLGEIPMSITPPVGELMRACDKKASKLEDEETTCKRVFETANLAPVTATGDYLRFAGRMMSSQDLVLLSVKIGEDSTRVVANCPNMAIASMLANEVAQAFAKSST
ncbi:AP-3 complex subunit beta-2-like [Phthorimaea operculella]|nr:AP-3 complex subunit beta-2-like [Phthorimaea operculella]